MHDATRKSKFYGAFVLNHRVVLHAVDASLLDGVAMPILAAAGAARPRRRREMTLKNCRVHPTHWLIYTDGCLICPPLPGSRAATRRRHYYR